MDTETPLGAKQTIHGRERVHCYGYWIKAYAVPEDSLLEKKRLIQALTRRLFNHVEHGINVPGEHLEEARRAYDSETDPARRRVKGAMLAGALFNRATEVFTKLVEIQALGMAIRTDNQLMRECDEHLKEALELGKLVLHRSGEEGIDELWGEPFKAFAFPIEQFHRSRYVKIAQTMRAIDDLAEALTRAFATPELQGLGPLVAEFAEASKAKCETLRTDPDVFDVVTSFAVTGERLVAFRPVLPGPPTAAESRWLATALGLVEDGRNLVESIARARVPMPKSARVLIGRLEAFGATKIQPDGLQIPSHPSSEDRCEPSRVAPH